MAHQKTKKELANRTYWEIKGSDYLSSRGRLIRKHSSNKHLKPSKELQHWIPSLAWASLDVCGNEMHAGNTVDAKLEHWLRFAILIFSLFS